VAQLHQAAPLTDALLGVIVPDHFLLLGRLIA
jgi:hypothetical protein